MFLFFVLFGLPYNVGELHKAVANLIAQNQLLLLIVLAVWFLYNLKCIDYITKEIKLPQQQFLTCLQNIGTKKCFGYLCFVQFMIFIPVIAYAVFIIIIALKNNAYIVVGEIAVFILIMLLITPIIYVRTLQNRLREISFHFFTSTVRISKTIITIPLVYIWNSRKQMLLIAKFFSLLLLLLFIRTYEPDHYDIRPLLLCFLLSTISNCAIVFEIKSFENNYLQLIYNFPISLFRRFMQLIIMYALLLLPELLLVWKAYPLFFHLTDYIQLILASVSLLVLLHTTLLTGNINMDAFIKIVFAIAMALFFIILYDPGIILPVVILLIAFGFFHAYYHETEKT